MTEFKTVFENEEAVRLLNYFISYKKIISKNKPELDQNNLADEYGVRVGVLPKPAVLVVK
jgi:hypothetical protein